MKDKPEKAENLDLEVLNHALSFQIKNIGVKNFESMALFDGVMDRLLTVQLLLNRVYSQKGDLNELLNILE